jgi:hypothetical protein
MHACFIVRDRQRVPTPISRTSQTRATAKLLTRDEARRIAANITKVTEAVPLLSGRRARSV